MTRQNAEDVYLRFAGDGHYLIHSDDLLDLLEVHDDAGRPLVGVIGPARCEMMGAAVEPWHCEMPGLPAYARDLWVWRLEEIERPAWLPDFDEIDDLT
jgi:hypothetical protein